MSTEQITVVLGVWEGYRIGTVGRFEAGIKGPTAQVWIELLPEPDRVAEEVRPKAQGMPSWHLGPLPLAPTYQPAGRNQQQDQGHQANGLRLPR